MNLKEDFRTKILIEGLRSDHKELARQAWVLRMLYLHAAWSDGEMIHNRMIELEGFLNKHLHDEESRILEILSDMFPKKGAAGEYRASIRNHKSLFALASRICNLPPSADEWFQSFQEFEKVLEEHANDEDKYIFWLPTDAVEKTVEVQKDPNQNEGRLITLANGLC